VCIYIGHFTTDAKCVQSFYHAVLSLGFKQVLHNVKLVLLICQNYHLFIMNNLIFGFAAFKSQMLEVSLIFFN